jgi:hypothetical protein
MPMHASTKIKNCVHAINILNNFLLLCGLLACWLADKQIAERNKLLFLTLQQLDYIFIFFVHHHQHHHVFFFFFFFCTNLLLLSLWVLKNLPTFLFGSKFRWKFF